MIVAVEFYVRCLNLRNNLPVPCSFCLQSEARDRKVVTLSEAYRRPDLVAVRHWHLSDCVDKQSLPTISEKLIPRSEIFNHDFVIVPNHYLMDFHGPCYIPSSLNTVRTPMTQEQFANFYSAFLRTDAHTYFKETWVWREFIKTYLPFLSGLLDDERDEVKRLRDAMQIVMQMQPELWHKWLHWRRHMLDFSGLPGELAFCREYAGSVFTFV